MSQSSRHPVVEAFFGGDQPYGGDEAFEVLQREALGGDPVLTALLKMQAAVRGRGSLEEAHAAVEKVTLDESLDPELAVLLLGSWAEVSFRLRRAEEMDAIVGREQSMVTEESAPELKSFLLIQEGLCRSRRGDKVGRLELLRKAVDVVPEHNSYYGRPVCVRATFLSQLGRGIEAEDDLKKLAEVQPGKYLPDAAFARFIRHVEACDLPAADVSLADLDSCCGDVERWLLNRKEYERLLACQKLRWARDASGAEVPEDARGGEQWESWAVVVDHLLAGRSRQALEAARARAEASPENALAGIGFDTFNLLRTELSNGNWEAAVRILDLRRERGNLHVLDDFFMARAELLAGRIGRAQAHFRNFMKLVKYYQWENRLDLELRMAVELSASDVVRLANWMRGEIDSSDRPNGVEVVATEEEAKGARRLVGNSRQLGVVREALLSMAALDVPVLISGPTGTGKELVARAIHEEGPRRGEPFLAVNCGAITEGLLASELFGHEKGAFTGASQARKGLFESAGKGTIFMDEIGEIAPKLQVALLRVLESGEVRPVGASRTRKTSCRILAATNAELEVMTAAGRFRQDLFYRLRRLEIAIPPLSERRDDILPLADYFLSMGRRDGRRPVMSTELRDALLACEWPGNVRELRNAIERMRLLNSDKLSYDLKDLDAQHAGAVGSERLAPSASNGEQVSGPVLSTEELLRSGRTALRRVDRLRDLFGEHGKLTRGEVARILGVSLPTATRDLKALCAEGLVEKIMPSASPRSHYFRLRSS
jgi:DNA-binding NtrC family response regulator